LFDQQQRFKARIAVFRYAPLNDDVLMYPSISVFKKK